MRRAVERRIIPRFVSFGYLLRQYTRRETLEDLLDSAQKEFGADLQAVKNDADRAALQRAIAAAATLGRIDALIYLHRLLKMWLPPHVATTSLMLALMIIHIIQVVYYAAR